MVYQLTQEDQILLQCHYNQTMKGIDIILTTPRVNQWTLSHKNDPVDCFLICMVTQSSNLLLSKAHLTSPVCQLVISIIEFCHICITY